MKTLNCPQCGDALELRFHYTKLTLCPSCNSSLLLEDEAVTNLGTQNLLSQEETLLKLHQTFNYKDMTFIPIGKVRYAYSLGFWEEWFVLDQYGENFWLSVDEGDFVKENTLELREEEIQNIFQSAKLSNKIKIKDAFYRVTEKDEGICQGFEGELPQTIQVNEKLEYLHLTALEGSQHITLEKEGEVYSSYIGEWIDAYEIEAGR